MIKLVRLSKTGIEYGDYAWNFASGCGNNIDGKCKAGGFNCWAYSISQRFEGHYPNGFKPTIYPEALYSPLYLKKPSRILCAFMGDLFWDCPEFNPLYGQGEYGEDEDGFFTLKGRLFDTIEKCPQHTFLFLTKQPQNLIKFSPYPDHCYVGVTATNPQMFYEAQEYLAKVVATIRYISLEPYLERIYAPLINAGVLDWLIIGSQTKPYRPPAIESVQEIVQACDKAGIPVFLKDNLWSLFDGSKYAVPLWAFDRDSKLRQEMPCGDSLSERYQHIVKKMKDERG